MTVDDTGIKSEQSRVKNFNLEGRKKENTIGRL